MLEHLLNSQWNKKDAEGNYESNAGGIAPRSLILGPVMKKTLFVCLRFFNQQVGKFPSPVVEEIKRLETQYH